MYKTICARLQATLFSLTGDYGSIQYNQNFSTGLGLRDIPSSVDTYRSQAAKETFCRSNVTTTTLSDHAAYDIKLFQEILIILLDVLSNTI